MHSWNYWYFQHIQLNIFGIHLKKVNILYITVLYDHTAITAQYQGLKMK